MIANPLRLSLHHPTLPRIFEVNAKHFIALCYVSYLLPAPGDMHTILATCVISLLALTTCLVSPAAAVVQQAHQASALPDLPPILLPGEQDVLVPPQKPKVLDFVGFPSLRSERWIADIKADTETHLPPWNTQIS